MGIFSRSKAEGAEPAEPVAPASDHAWPSREDAIRYWNPPAAYLPIDRSAVVPFWHLVARLPWINADDHAPDGWREGGIPVGWIGLGTGRHPGLPWLNGKISYLLQLLTLDEARPLIVDWATRAIVVADMTSDESTIELLQQLSAMAETTSPYGLAHYGGEHGYTCSVEGAWEASDRMLQGVVDIVGSTGWQSATCLFDDFRANAFFRLFGYAIGGPTRGFDHDVADGMARSFEEKMLVQTCAALAAAYSRPHRVPHGGVERLEKYVDDQRERLSDAERHLAQCKKNVEGSESLLRSILERIGEAERDGAPVADPDGVGRVRSLVGKE